MLFSLLHSMILIASGVISEEPVAIPATVNSPGTDDVSITILLDWTLPYAMYGIDDLCGFVYGCDPDEGKLIRFFEGQIINTYNLDQNNNYPYGVVVTLEESENCAYINDFNNPVIFYNDLVIYTWYTIANPAGTDSRGMDYDGTHFWISDVPNGVHRYQPGGVDDYMELSEISGQISGLSVFPYEGDTGLAVITQSTSNIYMYRWNGSDLVYLGYGTIPQSGVWSLGITYYYPESFYWCYQSGTEYHLAKLGIDITHLSRDTWAAIKTAL